jgi:hypothetical protein
MGGEGAKSRAQTKDNGLFAVNIETAPDTVTVSKPEFVRAASARAANRPIAVRKPDAAMDRV